MSNSVEQRTQRSEELFGLVERHMIEGQVGVLLDAIELCDEVGVRLKEEPLIHATRGEIASERPGDQFPAFYDPGDPDGPSIHYSQKLVEPVKSYILLHELFHHLQAVPTALHQKAELKERNGRRKDVVVERYAWTFAQRLLAPDFLWYPALRSLSFTDLARAFPLPPDDLMTKLLQSLGTDAFCFFQLPRTRGRTIDISSGQIVFQLRVPKNLRRWVKLSPEGRLISLPDLKLTGEAPRLDGVGSLEGEFPGFLFDEEGHKFQVVQGLPLVSQFLAQKHHQHLQTAAETLETVTAGGEFAFAITTTGGRPFYTMRQGQFAGLFHAFFTQPSSEDDPPSVMIAALFVSDESGDVVRRWQAGGTFLDQEPGGRTLDLYGELNWLRQSLSLDRRNYRAIYGPAGKKTREVRERFEKESRAIPMPPEPPPFPAFQELDDIS